MQLRIRTVKPELHKHEVLFDIEKSTGLPARIAWVGLFAACDREGRFNWRPRTLKAEILPFDEGADFSVLLNAWEKAKMIHRYEVDGEVYGWIPTFATRHQNINPREADSTLPPHPNEREIIASLTRGARVADACEREGKGKEGNGIEGKEGASIDGAQPPSPELPFGEGPHLVSPEIQVGAAETFAISHISPSTQQAWLDKHGAEILKSSLERAVSLKLGQLKSADPRRHTDWHGYLTNWFKKEKNVKFKSSRRPDKVKDPPPGWPIGGRETALADPKLQQARKRALKAL
jgi:hypothetical protein